jgi:hypothetical protein
LSISRGSRTGRSHVTRSRYGSSASRQPLPSPGSSNQALGRPCATRAYSVGSRRPRPAPRRILALQVDHVDRARRAQLRHDIITPCRRGIELEPQPRLNLEWAQDHPDRISSQQGRVDEPHRLTTTLQNLPERHSRLCKRQVEGRALKSPPRNVLGNPGGSCTPGYRSSSARRRPNIASVHAHRSPGSAVSRSTP